MNNVLSRKQLGIPYGIFLLLFVAAPLLVLIYYAFTNGQGQFTVSNLCNFFTDPNTLGTLCYSFALAFVVTIVCLLIAYPVAYILAQSEIKRKAVRTWTRLEVGEYLLYLYFFQISRVNL